jgi:invasion protein IalB
VRINISPAVLAVAALFALSPAAIAQDGKSDPELPEGAGTQFGPRTGVAQQPGQGDAQAPKTETVGTYGKWAVQCTELPAQQGGKSCGMVQGVKNDKDERVQISVIVSRIKRDGKALTFMRVLAPIGVYLPTGLPVEIDGGALPKAMVYSRCLPRMCEAFGEMSPDTLNRFKKGNDATFYLYDRPGNGYPMKISLDGFGNALASLDTL